MADANQASENRHSQDDMECSMLCLQPQNVTEDNVRPLRLEPLQKSRLPAPPHPCSPKLTLLSGLHKRALLFAWVAVALRVSSLARERARMRRGIKKGSRQGQSPFRRGPSAISSPSQPRSAWTSRSPTKCGQCSSLGTPRRYGHYKLLPWKTTRSIE